MVECEEATNVSVFGEAYQTMDALVRNSIYIYNEKRPHFSCFYKTPKQMHLQNEIKIKTYKNKYPCNHVITGI
jgi:transposase InsO family protein